MSRDWIEIEGEHINLATATSIEERGPQGTEGYKINHGGSSTTLEINGKPDAETEPEMRKRYEQFVGIATAIRVYLYDRRIQVDVGPRHRDEGDY